MDIDNHGRHLITAEERAKIEAVKLALQESDNADDKLMLKATKDFERRAGMNIEEKLTDIAQDNSMYKDSSMQQRFSAIKRICAIRGSIYIEVDEHDAYKAARLQAFRMLGPLASAEDMNQYIAEHMTTSKILSVPRFLKNLKMLAYMVRKAPQLFGEGTGGGPIKDILSDARGAIKEAVAYLKKHRDSMPAGLYKMLTNSEMDVSNKTEFVKYLGEDWEKEMLERARMSGGIKLLEDTDRSTVGENLLLDKNYKR